MSMRPGGQDRLEIMELMPRYSWVLDVGDIDALSSVFTSDAIFIINGRPYEGIEAISAYFGELVSRDNWAGTQHYNTQAIFETGSETRCELRSYCTVVFSLRDGTDHFRMLASYRDTCSKVDGRWLISRREARVWNPARVW